MSRTTMMVVEANGVIKDIAEFHNSHGFAPRIWTPICARFFGQEHKWLFDKCDELRPLWRDPKMPLHWRIALACTFDYAIVSKDSRNEVAAHLRRFANETYKDSHADHLMSIADKLEALPEDCMGACFHGTSVSENPWNTYDDEKDAMVPYDFDTRKDHFFVLESVKANENTVCDAK